ncbi:hypothetical protein, partial [Dialister succinatiphilus]|uniref:hypothetical protein n=1 Tax=Dialister succinatiphilus TaxID=487173 RepID=UPI001CA36D38
ADANSELFKEAHDETVHKNSYKRKLYELISASQGPQTLRKYGKAPPQSRFQLRHQPRPFRISVFLISIIAMSKLLRSNHPNF